MPSHRRTNLKSHHIDIDEEDAAGPADLRQRIAAFENQKNLRKIAERKKRTSIEPIDLRQRIRAFENANNQVSERATNRGSVEPIDLRQRIEAYKNYQMSERATEYRTNRGSLEPIDLRQRIQAYKNQFNPVSDAARQNMTLPEVDLRQRIADYNQISARPKPKINLVNPTVDLEPLRIASPDRARDLFNWKARQPIQTSNISPIKYQRDKPSTCGPHSRFYPQDEQTSLEEIRDPVEPILPVKQRLQTFSKPPDRNIKHKENRSAYIDRAKELYNWNARKPINKTKVNSVNVQQRVKAGPPTAIFYGSGWGDKPPSSAAQTTLEPMYGSKIYLELPQPHGHDKIRNLNRKNVNDYEYNGPIAVPDHRRQMEDDSVTRHSRLPIKMRKMQFEKAIQRDANMLAYKRSKNRN